ncbi:DMT family transporter [Bifidobacterium aerophilum]|uniref:EamA family transporter n=1 Tax=Bifidobacterium aerophilum TaxID=1798155 RepID=A0A6N9Z780_9BIFI|nr:DMT family transporter [Bifidobacterium aerophilum]NEG89983.1 EamA family transporter [Bifidobacterium aerophilum]
MTRTFTLSPTLGKLMLLACAMLWGGSYPTAKVAMSVVTPQWLMAIRLLAASAIMLILFRKQIVPYLNRRIIVPGLLVGFTYWGTMVSQMTGLTMIEPGRSAFLTAAYCVIVPFTSWLLLHQRPTARNLVAAALCLTGVGFVSLSSGLGGLSVGLGDLLTLLCAFVFSFNLVWLGKFGQTIHPVALTFSQFMVAGVCCLVGAILTEPAPTAAWLQPNVLACLVYLFFGATMCAQIMQNIGLKVTPPSQASLIMCLETVFSLLFSVLFYGERVQAAAGVGFALIFSAILCSQIHLNGRMLERLSRR